jgi:hypothetical protein
MATHRKSNQREKAKPGDVLEVTTGVGLAYLQYVRDHAVFGELIRVLPGTFEERPAELGKLANGPERYFTFFPVRLHLRDESLRLAARCPVPDRARGWPLMRAEGASDPDGVVLWWLISNDMVDRSKGRRVSSLNSEDARLSIREVINLPMLIHRIEIGWMPEHDTGVPLSDPSTDSATHGITHYLYFRQREQAELVVGQLASDADLGTEVRVGADGRWLVTVRHENPRRTYDVEDTLRELSDSLGGEYDGHETFVGGEA